LEQTAAARPNAASRTVGMLSAIVGNGHSTHSRHYISQELPMSSSRTSGAGDAYGDNSLLRKAAMAVGAVFVLVGILGFIPGVTTNYDQMEFAGHESGAKLLDLFQVSILHNIVHLLFGVAGLAAAKSNSGARNYLIGGGVIYLVLWIYGLLVGQDTSANFVPVNGADDWLHLLLGIGMIGLGVALSRDTNTARTTA
jgi:hypothetical protein